MKNFSFLSIIVSCCLIVSASCNDCEPTAMILEQIKVIPIKSELVTDVNYNEIIKEGTRLLPCLAAQVVNDRRMNDPRKCPPYNDFMVGDLAYILFVKLSELQFEFLLPREIQQEYKTQGVYAYFMYVAKKENRQELSEKCLKWCEKNKY